MKTKKRICFTSLAFLILISLHFTGCSSCNGNTENFLNDVVTRSDYTSVYSKIGKQITIEDVKEDARGLAYVMVDGKEYELGMDFLSMAMVYNTAPTQSYPTSTAVYNEWWKLFIQRWNYLAPEAPLYSNQYYDIYNAKIDRLKTNPYWSVTDAIVGAKVVSGENSVVLGSNTELSGLFRNSSFGKSSPSSADLAIENLTTGYATVTTNDKGEYVFAGTSILKSHSEQQNEQGEKTYTMQIANDLTFSNGAPITAKNYIAPILAGSSKVMREAGGNDASGLTYVGYEDFHSYDGKGETVPFKGVRLIDDYTFSVTIKEEYSNYYYAMRYGAFVPVPTQLYVGDFAIKDDGQGAYIDKGYYAKTQKNGIESYTFASQLTKNMNETSKDVFPYSGPYIVESYDKSAKTAVLKRNSLYKGDIRGKASIDRISYVKIIGETQLDQLKKGQVDVLASVTGGEETKSALAIVDNVKFKETHYDRAGYGKLAFRCDFSPTQFASVRRAIMHTIDRNEFAQTFTGGYGSVVYGPYYAGSPSFIAVKDKIKLNRYDYSIEKAKQCLIEGGWIYNQKGENYKEGEGVRYKKLSGYELSYYNLAFASTDNKYKTVKINGEYYMPLVINWMGTQPNPVTDQLITAWQNNPNASAKIGAYITYSSGDMTSALYGEYCQMPAYGFSKARYNAVNFATGFTSSVYDQSFAWTIDQSMYANYSSNFLMDSADFYN